jgi:hypothetical protein
VAREQQLATPCAIEPNPESTVPSSLESQELALASSYRDSVMKSAAVIAASVASDRSVPCGRQPFRSMLIADPPSLFRYSVDVRFASAPSERVTVFAYEPMELERFYRQPAEIYRPANVGEMIKRRPDLAPTIEGTAEAMRRRSAEQDGRDVHLRGYISDEGTLKAALELALESLGDTLSPLMSDAQRRKDAGPMTASELRRWHRANPRAWGRALLAAPWRLVPASGSDEVSRETRRCLNDRIDRIAAAPLGCPWRSQYCSRASTIGATDGAMPELSHCRPSNWEAYR